MDGLPITEGKTARQERAWRARLNEIMDYYAGTEIPIDRIAKHTGLDEKKVREMLRMRGRKS